MKIVKVEAAWIKIPCNPVQGLSTMDITHSTDAVCRVTTDEGIYGIGEGRGADLASTCKIIMEEYAPLLIGENPMESQRLWDKVYNYKLAHMTPGTPPDWEPLRPYQAAMAALDIAIWDIKAKALDMSVCELLGGAPRPMPAYLSKAFYVQGQTLDDMCNEAIEELERNGYTHMKMRVGRYDGADAIKRIAAVRKALGADMKISVDVNHAFDYRTALEVAREVEQYDLMWIEEPICRIPQGADVNNSGYDWDAYLGKLADATTIPMSAGENHYNLHDCYSLITKGKIKYMQYDATKCGGVTEWMKVAALCEANSVLMAPHHVPHFHVMLNAAVSNSCILECYDNKRQHPAWPYLFDGFPEVKNGHVQCPTGKGWGMDINERFLEEYGVLVSWDIGQ